MISASRSYQNNLEVMNTARRCCKDPSSARASLGQELNHGRRRYLLPSDVNVASSPASSAAADATITSDRFLKLLVAQMKNQDPLNPWTTPR